MGWVLDESGRLVGIVVDTGEEIDSADDLSSSDIQKLLQSLRPYSTDSAVIDAEVLHDDRYNRPTRIEPGDETLPRGLVDMGRGMENTKARTRDGYGTARSYGRYNPPTEY
jgi:hypothetical protein